MLLQECIKSIGFILPSSIGYPVYYFEVVLHENQCDEIMCMLNGFTFSPHTWCPCKSGIIINEDDQVFEFLIWICWKWLEVQMDQLKSLSMMGIWYYERTKYLIEQCYTNRMTADLEALLLGDWLNGRKRQVLYCCVSPDRDVCGAWPCHHSDHTRFGFHSFLTLACGIS